MCFKGSSGSMVIVGFFSKRWKIPSMFVLEWLVDQWEIFEREAFSSSFLTYEEEALSIYSQSPLLLLLRKKSCPMSSRPPLHTHPR